MAAAALELYEVDPLGLDRLDRAVLESICVRFAGGPVGLGTLAMSVGEEAETVEEVAEPFPSRQGFLMRTPSGRVADEPRVAASRPGDPRLAGRPVQRPGRVAGKVAPWWGAVP